MTTPQIIIFTVFAILYIIGYCGVAYSKNEVYKVISLILIATSSMFYFFIGMVYTIEVNKLKKQVEAKCPEYKKLDNVYILK